MKVRINALARGATSTPTNYVQKKSADGTRFAFLCSILDAANDVAVDTRFDSVQADGVKIGNFKGTFEIWFDQSLNQKIVDKFSAAKAASQVLIFEFTCASTSKGDTYLKDSVTSQTIILNADAFARRAFSVIDAPAVEGL
jgi:hypothetical protein